MDDVSSSAQSTGYWFIIVSDSSLSLRTEQFVLIVAANIPPLRHSAVSLFSRLKEKLHYRSLSRTVRRPIGDDNPPVEPKNQFFSHDEEVSALYDTPTSTPKAKELSRIARGTGTRFHIDKHLIWDIP